MYVVGFQAFLGIVMLFSRELIGQQVVVWYALISFVEQSSPEQPRTALDWQAANLGRLSRAG